MAWDTDRTTSPRNQSLPKDWKARKAAVMTRDGGICYRCGQPGADQCDHVVAVADGGSHELDNLAAAHGACVRDKNIREAQRHRWKHRMKRPAEKHPGLID